MHKLAVYGTLKKNHGNHRLLVGAKYLGTIKTDPKYTMYSLGGFPAVGLNGKTEITCEIYEVPNETMLNRIYNLEGYSGVRNSKHNWYDTTDVKTPWGDAEMFIMHGNNISNIIVEDGNWK